MMKHLPIFFSYILIAIGIPCISSAAAGVILDAHPYAWSDAVGYITFKNVVVDDTALSGFAWSANKGFINLDPALGGVMNDGTGNLSGFAWGEQLGWIDFNDVTIDIAGRFFGTAQSDTVGTITFDCFQCDVETDWRRSVSTTTPEAGATIDSRSNNESFRTTIVATANAVQLSDEGFAVGTPSIQPTPSSFEASASAFSSARAGKSPLFDVLLEPVHPPRRVTVPSLVLLVIGETALLILGITLTRWIRTALRRTAPRRKKPSSSSS